MRPIHSTRPRWTARAWDILLLGVVGLTSAAPGLAAGDVPADTPPLRAAVLDAARFESESSMSGGIQEAMDALPPEGGAVLVPPGVITLRRPIVMKPRSRLSGAGRATVLRKGPAFLVRLAADAARGQDWIDVDDPAPIRPGACLAVADTNAPASLSQLLIVTNVTGRRVQFHSAMWPAQKTLSLDLAVGRGAAAMNLFPLIVPAPDTVISDLELDGAVGAQLRDHPAASALVQRDKLGAGLYPAQGKVARCWIHDCSYGVHVSVPGGIELLQCDVYRNTGDGVHLGGGPHSKIAHNRLFENGAGGLYFCYANRKVLVTDNEIMRNMFGISGLDDGNPARDTTADRGSIISRNLIYENRCAGIYNGGRIGPRDFVITDNILHNNWQGHEWRGLKQAGMLLNGPQRCVIAGNRSYDDRETYPRFVLRQPAKPGTNVLSIGLADQNVHSEPYLLPNDRLRLGAETGCYAVVSFTDGMAELDRPLPGLLPAGTPVARVSAQDWGIAVLGTASRDNLIAGNVCAGNRLGGLLIEQATNQVVGPNVGRIVAP